MKVVVLGFDGMDPSMMRRLQSKGLLGTFSRLENEGIYSEIESTVIPMSPAAWSSFLTGTNPGKHGIYDFITRTGTGIDDFKVVTADDRQAPALWEYCNIHDCRVGAVGVPVTYPVDDLDGFMVSGFPTPDIENSFTPSDLPKRSPIDLDELHPKVLYDGTNKERFVADQLRYWDALETFHEFALSNLEWDVYVSVFKQTDDIAHICWDEEPLHDVYERANSVVEKTIDRLESLDEPYRLFVMSDHGFGPIDKTLFLNNVLIDLGYLELKSTLGSRIRQSLHRHRINLLTAYRILARFGLAESVLSLSYDDSTVGDILTWLRKQLFLGIHDIDPDQSAGFSRGNFGQIFLQDDGVRDSLMAALENYTIAGTPIIEELYTADEQFHGPMAERAPDIMLRTPEYRYVTSRGFALATDEILTDHVLQRTADHKPTGIFYAYGDGIDPAVEIATPRLEDLLPSILATVDVPIPAYSDGAVIDGLGIDDQPIEEYDVTRETKPTSHVDRDAIKERLESLGYTS